MNRCNNDAYSRSSTCWSSTICWSSTTCWRSTVCSKIILWIKSVTQSSALRGLFCLLFFSTTFLIAKQSPTTRLSLVDSSKHHAIRRTGNTHAHTAKQPTHKNTTNATKQQNLAAWTVMIYAQTDTILNNFVIRNFQAMSTIGSNKNLNIIVQWNKPGKDSVWRYKIEKNRMILIDTQSGQKRLDFTEDLIDFASFVTKNYPAQKYAFILSNHGVGIIDPAWNQLQHFVINPRTLHRNSRLQIAGITTDIDYEPTNTTLASAQDSPGAMHLDATHLDTSYHDIIFDEKETDYLRNLELWDLEMRDIEMRGILFDISNRNYLDNQGLVKALDHITKHIICKKFALIGMDACLMSMLEVFYQIKHFADYAVASEEVELAHGWNYPAFLETLATDSVTAPQLAQSIVLSFEEFYRGKTKYYTQSAINLEGIDYIKENLDLILLSIEACKKIDPTKMKEIIANARKLCFELSISCYVDIHSFYTELQTQLTALKLAKILPKSEVPPHSSSTQKLSESQPCKDLQALITQGLTILDTVIIAHATSPFFSQAKGLSIYFPQKSIDPSYLKTQFVQDSLWLPFLQNFLN